MDELSKQIERVEGILDNAEKNIELLQLLRELRKAKSDLVAQERKIQQNISNSQFCEIIGQKNFVGLVKGTSDNGCFVVEVIGSTIIQEVEPRCLRMLKLFPLESCKKGSKVQAIYSKDGQWHNAVICQSNADDECMMNVIFDGFESRIAVHRSLLRQRTHHDAILDTSFYTTTAGYKIPISLEIHETDNASVKQAKKRKIQEVKVKQRILKIETNQEQRKRNWQEFTKRKQKD